MSVCGVCGWWERICKCTPTNGIQVHTFTPHTYEDLDIYPIAVTSKRQLREECKRRELWAERLV